MKTGDTKPAKEQANRLQGRSRQGRSKLPAHREGRTVCAKCAYLHRHCWLPGLARSIMITTWYANTGKKFFRVATGKHRRLFCLTVDLNCTAFNGRVICISSGERYDFLKRRLWFAGGEDISRSATTKGEFNRIDSKVITFR